ncbi:hypothetical protein H6G97_33440 [Nostoc flagelliforme FACHB-838]|uniref:Uncharacterized protein n=1 Tax=Nostoc flagelliforme FACHB-838 TaxID=2692904 RepID=A0ABR8DXH9_9NOSO|nr:hypothetical protein [Nostoc flagelliforme]MBD2534172.1 hypothetical protein [Nostoc flagelliforme FACHB-838]
MPQNFASVYHVGGVLTTLLRPAGGLRPSFASLKTQKLRSPLRGVCTDDGTTVKSEKKEWWL